MLILDRTCPWRHSLKDSIDRHPVGPEPAFLRSAASEPTGDLRLGEGNPTQHELVPILNQIDRERVAATPARDDVKKKDGQVGLDPATHLGIVLIPWEAHGG